MDERLIGAAVAMLVFAGFSGWMDTRRNNREHLDKVGWVNWPLVMILALIGAAMLAIAAVGQ